MVPILLEVYLDHHDLRALSYRRPFGSRVTFLFACLFPPLSQDFSVVRSHQCGDFMVLSLF